MIILADNVMMNMIGVNHQMSHDNRYLLIHTISLLPISITYFQHHDEQFYFNVIVNIIFTIIINIIFNIIFNIIIFNILINIFFIFTVFYFSLESSAS